jgi:cysteine desulfurase
MDHHATTAVDERVLARMLPYFREAYGNPASRNHAFGWAAEAAVDAARAQVAGLIGATAREITFTSGATESNNLALFGTVTAGQHVVTQATEHKAVLDPVAELRRRGAEVTVVGVGDDGRVDPEAVEAALRPHTVLCSIMHCNNEIGTIQPIEDIGRRCRARGVWFHTDAAQLVPRSVEWIDLCSLSAHKMYGPKGIGALYVRRRDPRVTLRPLFLGGGHERGLRSGTLNVPAIVGFGAACELALEPQPDVAALRDRLWAGLSAAIHGVHANGSMRHRHPGNLHVSFDNVEAEALILSLRDVAISSGAACASVTLEPSHVLKAVGLSPQHTHNSVRFGLGRHTTDEEVDTVIAKVVAAVRTLTA